MSSVNSSAVSYAKTAGAGNATESGDRIVWVNLSLAFLPLATPVSDAKVLTGRQKPLTEVAIIVAEIETRDGFQGIGFSYSKRAGGQGIYAHACEIADALIGEDPNDIDKIYTKLLWAGASVGRSGMAVQAISPFDIALWDMKARRAQLPLAKLLGAHRDSVQCYNTSGGFLHTPLDQVIKNVGISRENGIGGIKLKVGQPNTAEDLHRLTAVRQALGDNFPLMVDANQQWDRETAIRMGRKMEQFNLVWIEEPLDAYDVEGHAALTAALDTPIATGEMLTSFREHEQLILVMPATLCSRMHRALAALRRSCKSWIWRHVMGANWLLTSRWRFTFISPPPIRSNPGLSILSGSTRCSMSNWNCAKAAC